MPAVLGGVTQVTGAWLKRPSLEKVIDALQSEGQVARVVGGAVRNALMGRRVGEIDIATTAKPREVVELAARRGLGAHPTGIDHGTITVVSGADTYEVTTLRRDVETDGRHAIVAFTDDWAEDAHRRDFTINALYCALDGSVHDFVGGLDDLRRRKVRFIDDAETRIREDYLRILRFFRFSADFGRGHLDADGLRAAVSLKDGIANLSAERLRGEMLKLLAASHAADVSRVMESNGILAAVLDVPTDAQCLTRLQAIEMALGQPPDPLARLAALAAHDKQSAAIVASRLRLSNAETARLESVTTNDPGLDPATSDATGRAAVFRLGAEGFRRAIRVAWARSGAPPASSQWRVRSLLPDRWTSPPMPFSGAAIVALGVAPGPKVGQVLRRFQDWWIESDFVDDRVFLSTKLTEFARTANEH